jgi:SpoVK/Ycf46/Vps4 family AAA+-type ATPase
MQGLVGSSEENMRKAIQIAEACAPCILWIDEIEKGFSGTGSSNFSDAGTTSRVFGTFITWLNEKQSEVFVVATANDVTQLPPELLRKGRFDEIFFVDLPDAEERKEIFRIHLRKLGRDPEKFDLDTLSQNSEGFSGADIREAIVSSMFDVFVEDAGTVDIHDRNVVTALKEVVPLSQTMKDQIKNIRNWSVKNRARSSSCKVNIE